MKLELDKLRLDLAPTVLDCLWLVLILIVLIRLGN